MGIVDDLSELFDSSVTVHVGTLSGSGVWTQTGTEDYAARYEGGSRMVRRPNNNQEVVSSVLCLIQGVLPTHDASLLRFTIPSSFSPHFTRIQAIRVDPVHDETGIVSAEVYLP